MSLEQKAKLLDSEAVQVYLGLIETGNEGAEEEEVDFT